MSFDPLAQGKKVPRKKYFYQYAFPGEDLNLEDLDDLEEIEAEFEQPKGRRQARQQTHSKRKRQVSDYY